MQSISLDKVCRHILINSKIAYRLPTLLRLYVYQENAPKSWKFAYVMNDIQQSEERLEGHTG